MAFLHGKGTSVYLGSVDLSPYLTGADFALDLDTADTTTFHATWKTAAAGTLSSTLGVSGLYDTAETSLWTMIQSAGSGVLTYCPGAGTAIGDVARLLNIFDTNYAESVPVGGMVAMQGSFLADSTVGDGYVLHPLGEDTNTTTGANRDDGAATATGWTMQLHVTAVDAGSWVIKLVDASASNFSDVADVTGGAFTAATGATSQRLQSAASTTALRRYVRYVATRTGGSAGDGCTFVLSLARNR